MRILSVSLFLAGAIALLGMSAASAAAANNAAIAKASSQANLVISVAGGCGRGWHRGPRGRCIRN